MQRELPFYYPGQVLLEHLYFTFFSLLASPFNSNHFLNGFMLLQICYGQVTTVHLYQGAFVNIGCVHEGYVHWILLHDEFTMNLMYLI